MKRVYPVILTPYQDEYLVEVPDFGIMTQGKNLADAIDMARDAICLTAVDMQEDHKSLPKASEIAAVSVLDGSFSTLVDIDVDAYKRRLDTRTVRKNCTIPSWLNAKAESAGINFSEVLREALENRLNV